jgi:hypothetical protein
VAMRTHEREHDQVRLQGEPVLDFKGTGDAKIDCHEMESALVA